MSPRRFGSSSYQRPAYPCGAVSGQHVEVTDAPNLFAVRLSKRITGETHDPHQSNVIVIGSKKVRTGSVEVSAFQFVRQP